jgi:hypothetical protein
MALEPERWALIAAAPDYDVSTWGRVKTRQHTSLHDAGEIVDVWRNAEDDGGDGGYWRATLAISGRAYPFYVHRIELTAFVDDPRGRVANHINGNKSDNYIGNLEWVSRSDNLRHAWLFGLFGRRRRKTHCRYGHPLIGENQRRVRGRDRHGNRTLWIRCRRCGRAKYCRRRAVKRSRPWLFTWGGAP